jgi:biotin-dependent carboxylase-like uncharacterized protein
MIEIVDVGFASTFQDLGRPGRAHLGIGRSGAVDRVAHRLANRLVGNAEELATIETCGGLVVRTTGPVSVAVTGARGQIDVADGPPMAVNVVAHLPAGATVALRMPQIGVRYYVAVRGGLAVDLVLGSRSFDTLAGIGPRLQVGPVNIGLDPRTSLATEFGVRPADTRLIDIVAGPRRDWFTTDAWSTLLSAEYVVNVQSNRVGSRLTGPALERLRREELPSEGIVEGALQVPPDGQPIAMLADHPVTGGYPVIAVIMPQHVPSVAQAPPGTALRFRHKIGETSIR